MTRNTRPSARAGGSVLATALLLGGIGAPSAQEIHITGRILERALLNPVPGATVRLEGQPGLVATTGSDGRFLLSGAVTALNGPPLPPASPPMLPGLLEGEPSDLPRDASGRIGSGAWRFLYPADGLGPVVPGGLALAKAAVPFPADRVDISRAGLAARSIPVTGYRQDLGDVILDYPPRRLGLGVPPVYGADALFDGTRKSLDAEWEHWMGTYRLRNNLGPTPITWQMVADPVDSGQVVKTCCRVQWGDEDLVTKRKYKDFQLHVEFNLVSPPRVGGSNPGPANSGVYLQSLYEIQVKDDYGKAVLGTHDVAAILNEFAAPQNLAKPLGRWQSYDITFRAARFRDGVRAEKARLTLHWNGVLVHRNRETANEHNTGVSSDPLTDDPKGLKLQSEGHDVRFRNIWIKELNLVSPDTDLGF